MNELENNKLIAEFMGITPNEAGVYHVSKHKGYSLENLQYHTEWNWLMPVVERIEQVHEGVPQELINLSLFSTIDEVYQAVVEFIKLHNLQFYYANYIYTK